MEIRDDVSAESYQNSGSIPSLKREIYLTAASYLTGFVSFLTVLTPGASLLIGRDLGYFNLDFFATNPAFIVCIIVALAGILCGVLVKEYLSITLNILSVAFNCFLIWVYSSEGILQSIIGFLIFCAFAIFIFIIVAIATLIRIPRFLSLWKNKSRSPVETVRLWAYGAMLIIVLLGLVIGGILLLDM